MKNKSFTMSIPPSQEKNYKTHLSWTGGHDIHNLPCQYFVSYKTHRWEFSDSSMVKTLPFNARDSGSTPSPKAKIPQGFQPKKQNIKQKQYCNKLNKD